MRKFALLLMAILTVGARAQQQDISEINWTDSPKMESKAIPSQTMASLNVTANIPNADIYLNNEYLGKTPLITRNLAPGIYKLHLSRNGYYDREFYIRLNTGTENTVYIELLRITGFLNIDVQPANANLYIDGRLENAAFFELEEGSYLIEVKAFGYETWSARIGIMRRQTKTLTVNLQKAEFGVSQLTLANRRFNPQSPANLGKLKVEFTVDAPGSGTLEIETPDGNPVNKIELSNFTTWRQAVYWNGRDFSGKTVPDGTYVIRLTAQGTESSAKTLAREARAEIDSGIFYPIQPLTALGGSFGMNPSPLLFPRGSSYAAFTGTFFFSPSKPAFITAPVAFSFLTTPLPWLEASITALMYLDGSTPIPFLGAASIKAGAQTGNFVYAGFLRYGIASQNILLAYTPAGLGAGAMFGGRFGVATISAHGEYVIGGERGFFVPFSHQWNAGLSVHLQKSLFSGTLWSKWISNNTLLSGIDASVLIPGTNILVNGEYAVGYPIGKSLFMSLGIGLGFLF